MIDYEYLEDAYDNLPTWESVPRNNTPQGSLTDNVKMQTVRRDAAHKHVRKFKEMGYYQK